MRIVFIILSVSIINSLDLVNCKDDYIPVLLWTSPQMPEGPTLALNKINRELFARYLSKKLSYKKPLVIVFMEQILSSDDFHWRDENVLSPFPFLSSMPERVDFFPYVESPHEAFNKLVEQGYKWKQMRSDWRSTQNHSSILLMEFRGIEHESRGEVLRKHDETMAGITRQLKDSVDDWICIYTARNAPSRHSIALQQLSSWHVESEPPITPRKRLYLYKDDILGMALMTRGPIKLHLPTHRNSTTKSLEEYVGASFTRFEDNMDLVVWFTKYTLTFYMTLLKEEWLIESVHIQNDDGHALKLWPKVIEQHYPQKCYARFCEFESKMKPIVKVELSKYKVVNVNDRGGSCVSPYTVPFLCIIMFMSVVIVSFLWSMILRTYTLPKQSKLKNVQLSIGVSSSKSAVFQADKKS